MAAPGRSLTSKQERAISALLAHSTVESAASAGGVSERSIYRWLRDEQFRAAFDEARRQALQDALRRLQAVAGEAVDALREIIEDKDVRPAERVSAARVALDFAMRGSELLDVQERLAALEVRAKNGRLR